MRRSTTQRPARSRPRLEHLEDRCTPTAGLLDPTFGTGGITTTAVGAKGGQARAVALQPDGKIVVAGYQVNLSTGSSFWDLTVARYTAAGALDPTFGAGGVVTTSLVKKNDSAAALVLQPDGKILVGGSANLDTSRSGLKVNNAFALVRYNANGTLDTSFGGTGKVTTELASNATDEAIAALALQPDGKIVAIGSSNANLAVARYNANGSLDSSFDGDGKRVLDLGGNDYLRGGVLQSDGKIVAAGYTSFNNPSYDAVLVRFNPNGSLDPSFGTGGVVQTDIVQPGVGSTQNALTSIALQNGRIVVAGSWYEKTPSGGSKGRLLVAAYTATGALDPSFGTDYNGDTARDGYTTTALNTTAVAGPIAVDPTSGKIVVSGGVAALGVGLPGPIYDVVVARYNADGALDSGFGTNGVTVTAVTPKDDSGSAIAIQPDGRIVVAGRAGGYVGSPSVPFQFLVARYLGDAEALRAAAPAPAPAASTPLPAGALRLLVGAAIERWVAAGLTADQVALLRSAEVRVADLGGDLLGLATGALIVLDDDAAGWGWFAGPTPSDDAEFVTPGNQVEQGRMDLLTVLMHEMGHVLGLGHDDHGAMQEALAPGQRHAAVDHAIADWAGLAAEVAAFERRSSRR